MGATVGSASYPIRVVLSAMLAPLSEDSLKFRTEASWSPVHTGWSCLYYFGSISPANKQGLMAQTTRHGGGR